MLGGLPRATLRMLAAIVRTGPVRTALGTSRELALAELALAGLGDAPGWASLQSEFHAAR